MKPSYRHRFLSVSTGTRLELQWPRPHISMRAQLRRFFSESPGPGTPAEVDQASFRDAFRILADDPEASAAAFKALGYTVTTTSH